jgi:hypothetical protein
MSFTLVFNSAVTITNPLSGCTWTAVSGSGNTQYTTTGTPTSLTEFTGQTWSTKLTQVLNIPTSVTSIGSSAFEACTALTSINIPTSVTTIAQSSFFGCSALISVIIPTSVTSIGGSSFYACSNLRSINISSITSMGTQVFRGCSGLESITIPSGITSIPELTFTFCSALTTVIIPYGVISIGQNAFYGCTALKSITIPRTVNNIGGNAFYGCTSLNTVYILSNSLVYIGSANTFNNISPTANVYLTSANSNISNLDYCTKITLTTTNCYIKQSTNSLDLSEYFFPLTGTPGPKTGFIINNYNGTIGLTKDFNEVFEPSYVGGTGAAQPTMFMIENYNNTGETKDLSQIFKRYYD